MQYELGIAVYSVLLVALYDYLTASVIKLRRRLRIGVGDGGYAELLQKIRAQGNFIEHVPLILVFMLLGIRLGIPLATFHLIGLCLVLGRYLHAYGVGYCEIKQVTNIKFRILGMLLTMLCYLLVIGFLMYYIAAMFYHPLRNG